jgi:Tfp pilus assembly protein PilV
MLTSNPRKQARRAAGQSMTEVIVIVFLVGVGTIGVVGLYGDNIRTLFGSSSEAVAGNSSVGNTASEAATTKWDLKGGSLSAYTPGGVANRPSNPGGSVNSTAGGGSLSSAGSNGAF